MPRNKLLLYGANGFSGRLIATAARPRCDALGMRLVLAGRNGEELAQQAIALDGRAVRSAGGTALPTPIRVFQLGDAAAVDAALGGSDIFAVINAAGPFDRTAEPLLKGAIRNGVHYVDINGEADVYRKLDDLGYIARQRKVAVVMGAGHSALTSDLMLDQALREIAKAGIKSIGTIRIVFSHVNHVSRGSAQTAWRSVREQVVVMRDAPAKHMPGARTLEVSHVPMGKIERTFDFGLTDDQRGAARRRGDKPPQATRRIATALNLLDLYPASRTAMRHMERVQRVEAFIEMPEGARIFVQWGSLMAPWLALPPVRALARAQVAMLPEGPDETERNNDRHTVLLQIDDGAGRTLVDWRMQTPDPYDFTADCVLAVCEGLWRKKAAAPIGWLTPAQTLDVATILSEKGAGLIANCVFDRRVSPQ